MSEIKYAFLTTVDTSLSYYMLPVAEVLDKKVYNIAFMCNMSETFYNEHSSKYRCVNLDLERGFHLGKTLSGILYLYKEFKKNKYDIIDYGTENVSFCASIAGWLAGVPVRIYNHWGSRYVGYTGFSRFLSKTIERTAALFSTDVRQVSPKNRELCIKDRIYPAKKVKVLGLGGTVGVDKNKFDINTKADYRYEVRKNFEIPQNAFVFGFVGRIQKDKGINELLAAFKSLLSKHSDIYLMLVGNIEQEENLNRDLLDWALKCDRVVFTGVVRDTYRYISAFDTMTHPSYREGFGLVLQEAGALEVPIITTNILGPSEFITNGVNGALVEAKNAEELEEVMAEFKQNDELREKYAKAVYEHTINNFERSVMVGRIVADREELLKGVGKI